MALSQLHAFSDSELSDLIEALESARLRAIPAIVPYADLAACAATGILYGRLEAAGDHDGALGVIERFGKR